MLPNYSMSIGNMLKMSLHQSQEKNIHELQLVIYLTILKKVGRLINNSKEEPDIVLLWEHNVVSLTVFLDDMGKDNFRYAYSSLELWLVYILL